MGWIICEPGLEHHEGYIVAVEQIPNSHRYRELGSDPTDRALRRVRTIQVACDCGWRSPLLFAPIGADWSPYIVLLHDDELEDRLAEYWEREHVRRLPRSDSPSLSRIHYGARELAAHSEQQSQTPEPRGGYRV